MCTYLFCDKRLKYTFYCAGEEPCFTSGEKTTRGTRPKGCHGGEHRNDNTV